MHSQILLRNKCRTTEKNKRYGQFQSKELRDLVSILGYN